MQAQYYKLPKQFHESLSIRQDVRPYFYDQWHFHSELELVYIIKGSGTRFIGDDISGFSSGDLVLLGAHLPHVWKSSDTYFKDPSKKKVEAIVLHFPSHIGGNELWELPEMNAAKNLLQQSHLGIAFQVPESHPIKKGLKAMVAQAPFERFINLLALLKQLSELKESQQISKTSFANQYQNHQSKRIDRIYNYILNNFELDIQLKEVADLANMTPAALCRFFKQKTRKSLSQFTNEVRIGYACKLIIEGQLSISDICFQCGYNNLSYFNRQFKKHTGKSPSAYLKMKREFDQ
jgi:AraC-like DNA-binding protein